MPISKHIRDFRSWGHPLLLAPFSMILSGIVSLWVRSCVASDYVVVPIPGIWCLFTDRGGVGIVIGRRSPLEADWVTGSATSCRRFGDGPEFRILGFRWHDLWQDGLDLMVFLPYWILLAVAVSPLLCIQVLSLLRRKKLKTEAAS